MTSGLKNLLSHRRGSLCACAGLTFGEMLIVLAVFSILAILFIFSSQTAMVKTRMSRVLQEEKLIARALVAYEADFMRPPTEAQGLYRLSQPMGYLPRVPLDPFSLARGGSQEYQYFHRVTPRQKWVVVSVGPDGDSDLAGVISEARRMRASSSAADGETFTLTEEELKKWVPQLTYDPTNGSVSNGDVITFYGD